MRKILLLALVCILPLIILLGIVSAGIAFTSANLEKTQIADAPQLPGCTTVALADGTDPFPMSDEQRRVRAAIVSEGRRLPVARELQDKAIIVAFMTAMVEGPRLNNPRGGHGTSVGAFQQTDPWGPAEVRHDPVAAARMFYHGGMGGQKGLLDRTGWEVIETPHQYGALAQEIQVSAYPLRYRDHYETAVALLRSGGGATTSTPTTECVSGGLSGGSADAQALLSNPRVLLAGTPRVELQHGIVDTRLIAALNALSQRYEFNVLNFKGNRTVTVGSGTVSISNHYYGRAADIFVINGKSVSSRDPGIRAFVADSVALGVQEVGQPFYDLESRGGVFANAAHQDHVHLGYYSQRTGKRGP